MNLIAKIKKIIKKYQLLNDGDKILVGVSGGADSIALIHILKMIAPVYNLELQIAHLDHQLRGMEAKDDAQFVKDFAQQLNIPVTIRSRDVKKYQAEDGLSLEDAARQVRYQFFFSLLDELNYDKLAVGHHANDQAETILMKFLRGAGLKGLGGINPKKEKIIRPLIKVKKEELKRYCRDNNLEWRVDKTNQAEICLRNRLRLNLLPQLVEEYNPNLVNNLNQMAEIFREEDEFLRAKTTEVLTEIIINSYDNKLIIAQDDFLNLHLALQRRLIRQIYRELTSSYDNLYFDNIKEVLELIKTQKTGLEKRMPENVLVKLSYGKIIFMLTTAQEKIDFFSYYLQAGESIKVPKLNMKVETKISSQEYPSQEELSKDNKAFFDLDKVGTQFKIRQRKEGDSFQPLGMSGTKKVKDFFIDQKIAQDKRERVPVFVTTTDDIFWLGRLRIDEKYKITEETDRILIIEINKLEED